MQLVEANREVPGSSYLSDKSAEKILRDVIDDDKDNKLQYVIDDDKGSNDDSTENSPNQLVLYKPGATDKGLEIEQLPDSSDYHISFQRTSVPKHSSKGLLSIGTFTVQCARCMQWRIIPTKDKYEKIRERILQEPFYCETAQEWRADVTCANPPDISQDGSRLWAIDKPNIAQAPSGWERLLRIRAEGGTRFADVYYVSPSGKRLRSMVEVQKYLLDHPQYVSQGVSVSQFSFQTPKPLQENYVRKRPLRLTDDIDSGNNLKDTGPLEPEEVHPLSWVRPLPCTDLDLHLNMSEQSRTLDETPAYHSLFEQPPAKKMAVRRPSQMVGDE